MIATLAPRIEDRGATGVLQSTALPGSIHGNHVALILNGSRLGEHFPVTLAIDGPIRDQDKGVDVASHFPEKLWKSQIEADKNTNAQTCNVDDTGFIPGRVDLGLLCV